MTDKEFYQKMADFHTRELKRSLIPHDEFRQKEVYDFYKEKNDLMHEYCLQKQQEKELEKEIEEKAYDCVEDALEDFLKGFNGNIDIKL